MSSVLLNYLQAMNWLEDEEGQGLVEYALIIVLVSLAVLATLTALGGGINAVFGRINAILGGAGAGGG